MTQSPREILTALSNRRRNSDIRADDRELGTLLQTSYERAAERETDLRKRLEGLFTEYTEQLNRETDIEARLAGLVVASEILLAYFHDHRLKDEASTAFAELIAIVKGGRS